MKKLLALSKKTFVFLLSTLLLFNTVVPYRNVQAEETSPATLTVQSASSYPGSYVSVYVEASNFNQLGGMEYTLMYDPEVLELSGAYTSDLTYSTSGDINTSVSGEIRHSFISLDGISGSGYVMMAEFYVKQDVKINETNLTLAVGEAYDVNFQAVSLQKQSGKITIQDAGDTTPSIYFYSYLDQYEGSYGDEVTYRLNGQYLYEMAAGSFEFTYDSSVLELISAEFSSYLQKESAVYSINTDYKGVVKASYIDLSAIDDYTDMIELRFRIIGTQETQTQIKCIPSELISEQFRPLKGTESTSYLNIKEQVIVPDFKDMYLKWDGQVVNNQISFEVWLEGNSNLAAGDFVFNYDSLAFEAISFTKSSQLKGSAYVVANPKMDEGQVKFSYVNTELLEEDTQLAVIVLNLKSMSGSHRTFSMSGSGTCDLKFDDIELEYVSYDAYFPNHIGALEISYSYQWLYTGEPVQPEVSIYRNGEFISSDYYSVSYRDNVNHGTGTIVIEGKSPYYGSTECTFEIRKVRLIEINSTPYKLEYLEGYEALDLSGGWFYVWYEGSDQYEMLDFYSAEVTGFDNSVVGEQQLTLNYGGLSADFSVWIIEKSVSNVYLMQYPDKTQYLEGKDELDLTGGFLYVQYNYIYENTVPLSDAVISGFDNTQVGWRQLQVDYEGYTIWFDVEIVPKSVIEIEMYKTPHKTDYLEGIEWFDYTGGEFKVYYNNDTTEILPLNWASVSGFDNNITGPLTLRVEYCGASTQFDVNIVPKSVQNVSVYQWPYQTEYLEGKDELNLDGGYLYVDYDNMTYEMIPFSSAEVTGFDNTKPGSQTVTVHYEGFSVTFDVYVREKTVSYIEIISLPDKTDYIQNYEMLDLTGGTIAVYYDNDTSETLSMSEIEITGQIYGFDNTILGINRIMINYKGYETFFHVSIVEKSLIGVEIYEYPSQRKYTQNYEELNLSGGLVRLRYDDESESILFMDQYATSGFDNSTLGEKIVTVYVEGFTVEFVVEIVEKELVSLEIERYPDKQTYIQNYEALDLSGGVLSAFFNDQSRDSVPMTEAVVHGFDNSGLGLQTITVSYKGAEVVFDIWIVEKSPVSIEVTTLPEKMTYIQNYEVLDLTGGVVTVFYNDETTEELSLTETALFDQISGFDHSFVGTNQIDVTYKGLHTSFEVEIVEKSLIAVEIGTYPVQREYTLNYEDLNLTGGTVRLKYDDESESILSMDQYETSGFDNSTLGEKIVTVYVEGFTVEFAVDVVMKKLVSMNWHVQPSKTSYIQNYEDLDVSDASLLLVFNDGSEEIIELDKTELSGFDNSGLGLQTITVSYKGKTVVFDICIVEKSPVSLELAALPEKLTYIQNYEVLDLSGGRVIVSYNDETTEEILLTETVVFDQISGFDNSQVGNCQITVQYRDLQVNFLVEIVGKSLVDIEMYSVPYQKKYVVNHHELNLEGGLIRYLYNDESQDIYPMSQFEVTGFDNSVLGKQTISVHVENRVFEFEIEVIDRVITELILEKVPDQLNYIQNYEEMNAAGGQLRAIYNDGESELIDMEEVLVTGFDNSTLGVQTLTAQYMGLSVQFEVEIVEKSLISVKVEELPEKTRYFQKIELLDTAGGLVRAEYNDESFELISMDEIEIEGFDSAMLGVQRLTGEYEGFEFSFEVEVYFEALEIICPEGRIYPNDSVQLDVNLKLDVPVKWRSENTKVASVDEDGTVIFHKAGFVQITAKLDNLSAKVTLTCEEVNLSVEADTSLTPDMLVSVFVDNSTDRAVQWHVSDESIIEFDEAAMTVKGLKPGRAELSARIADVTETLKFTVYPIDNELTLESTVIGYLESGMEVTEELHISTTAGGQNINHLVEYVSSNPSVATVDETGKVTGVSKGTATITISLKDDSLNRKVSLKVKVIESQVTLLEAFVNSDVLVHEGNQLTVDAEAVEKGTMIELEHHAYNRFGNEVDTQVKWTSSESRVATIKVVNGSSYLVIQGSGQTVLKLQAQDLRKESIELILCVKDYMPSLESSSVTVNRTQSSGTEVAVVPVYESEITGVRIEGNDKFHAEMNGAESFILKCDADVKTGKHKVHLIVSVDDEREYLFNLNVNVTAKLPSATAKAEGYINTFNPLESTLKLNINHKGNELEHIELEGTDAFERNFTVNLDGTVTVHGLVKEADGKLSTKGTVKLYYAGYNQPVEKAVSFTAKSVKPDYKLDKTSLVFNPQYNSSFEVKVLDKKTGEEVNLSELQVHLISTELAERALIDEDRNVLMIDGCAASGTLKIELSHEDWTKNMSFSVKLTAYTKAPQILASASIIELNARYNQVGAVELSMKPVNLMEETAELTVEPISTNAEKLNVSIQGTRVVAEVIDHTIASGRYQYKVSGRLNDGTELKGVTIVVKVERSEPTYKLSATSVKLNLNASGQEKIELVSTLSKNPFGAACTDVIVQLQENRAMPEQKVEDVMMRWTQQGLEVMLTQQAQKGTYTYVLTPVFDGIPSDKSVKLMVQVHNKAISASMSVKSSLNPLNRDGVVSASVKLNNLVDELESVSLSDNRFVAEVVNGVVQIRLNEGVVLKNQTVKMQAVLQLKNSQLQLEVPVSVKIARALPTLKLSTGTLNMMDTTGSGKLVGRIELGISKVNAQIDRIEAVNASSAFETRLTFDGQSYALEVYLINGALLKQKSVTTLKYKVHFVGESDETKSPVISFKIADKSASVKGVLLK